MDILAKPAVLAICVIALVAAALYAVVDSPDELRTIGRTEIELQPSTSDGTERKAASVTSLIVGLEARLVENPDDAKGWLLLAKSHDHLGDQRAAWAAYTRARNLGMSDASFEIALAATIGQQIPAN